MAALQIIALMLFTVTLLGEGFTVTDEEFQVGSIGVYLIETKFKSYLV